MWHSLGLLISRPEPVSTSFALVASFGRCKFRLSEDIVSLILQASIGGSAAHFRVLQLGDRVFKFFVSSKPVGLFVQKLNSFECGHFKVLSPLEQWWPKLAP